MDQTDSQNDSHKGEAKRNFSQSQYDILKRCSDKHDMTEWWEWRKNNPSEEVLLAKAYLNRFYLKVADLRRANLHDANLQGADLQSANLEGVSLEGANLQGANLMWANLQGADLMFTHLKGANLAGANLAGAGLTAAHLEGANLIKAHLEGVEFTHVALQKTNLTNAIVDGATLIWNCGIDTKTDFTGVALTNARIDPESKQLLEYNVRRMRWERWYKWKNWYKDRPWLERHKISQLIRQFIRSFWWLSDYGMRTWRIIFVFMFMSLAFAAVYYLWAIVSPPGIINSLLEGKEGPVPDWLVPFRAIYFSIVTMTTLGFGDMHANCQRLSGHVLLTIQVLFGYALLGALITRFAVLFTAGGPAGKFTEMDEETKKKVEGIKAKKKGG